jgi:hypothetical protein
MRNLFLHNRVTSTLKLHHKSSPILLLYKTVNLETILAQYEDRFRAGRSDSIPGRGKCHFLSYIFSRQAPRLTQPPIQWLPGTNAEVVK